MHSNWQKLLTDSVAYSSSTHGYWQGDILSGACAAIAASPPAYRTAASGRVCGQDDVWIGHDGIR